MQSAGQKILNNALLSDKFSAALQICRRARRYTVGLVSPLSTQSGPDLSKFSPELAQPKNSPPRKKND